MRRMLPVILVLLMPFGVMQQAAAIPAPSKIQFLDGGKDGGDNLAALEIVLNPGYMTYWRTPGEAGLPPVFDWSGSENVANVAVSWPAPTRIDEAGSIVYGFHDGVTLPLRVKPKRADAPVKLKLKLQYGVCKELCIPAESAAEIVLSGAGTDAEAVRQAIDALPKPVAFGDGKSPFAFISAGSGTGKPAFTVTLRVPAGKAAQLFAEGPEDWVLSTSDGKPGSAPGTFDFTVTLETAPATQHSGVPLRLTARAGTEAIETMFTPRWK